VEESVAVKLLAILYRSSAKQIGNRKTSPGSFLSLIRALWVHHEGFAKDTGAVCARAKPLRSDRDLPQSRIGNLDLSASNRRNLQMPFGIVALPRCRERAEDADVTAAFDVAKRIASVGRDVEDQNSSRL
jgi:hypothetical protein